MLTTSGPEPPARDPGHYLRRQRPAHLFQCSYEHFPTKPSAHPSVLFALRTIHAVLFWCPKQRRGSRLLEAGGNAWTTSPRSLFVLAWENGSEYFLTEASEVEIL